MSSLKNISDSYAHTNLQVNAHARSVDALVHLMDVIKLYQTPAGDFSALKGINLQVHPGEFISIVGKSGSGKSTLINIITGIDRSTSGQVLINGTPVHTLNEEQITLWRGRSIGIIFQFFQLLPTLTAVENVMLPMDYLNILSPHHRPELAMSLLEMVGMVDVAHRMPATLSGGQLQCIAIARALANDPPILAADEPTGNLDIHTAEVVFKLFLDLAARGKTVLMVTHDRELAKRAARTLVIADGLIVDEIRRN